MSSNPAAANAARVGPVLRSGDVASAIAEALRADNAVVELVDRGGYLRLSAPGRLLLRRASVEATLGRAFVLPGDLEQVLISFAGRMRVLSEQVEWQVS